MKKRICLWAAVTLLVFWISPPIVIEASDKLGSVRQENVQWQLEDGQQQEYLDELFSSMDFSELDSFLQQEEEKISFSDLVLQFLEGGFGEDSLVQIAEWIRDALFSEILANKNLLLEVVLLAFGFSILKNFAGAFQSSYISDMCFILVYCVLALMLLTSIAAFQEIVSETLEKSVQFMKMLVPTFCISMVFSSNTSTSIEFYQTAFLIIYLVEWAFTTFLLPMVHLYILMELFNHFWEEEKFLNLTELFRDLIHWGIKIAGVGVLGLNVVQNLISPAKDRMAQGAFEKAAAVIPGVGGAISSVSELLLGGGIVIKNCIGTAGLVVLFLMGLIPMLKVFCMAFFYKIAAAVTEPVTDKRISGALKGMSEGAILYMKLLGYSLVLFFLTISLTIAATSYIY